MNKENHSFILNRPPEERWKYVYDYCSSIKRCGNDNLDGCGYKQPTKINTEQFSTLIAVWEKVDVVDGGEKETITSRLTPEIIQKMFRRISNDDVSFMGFHPKWSRPEWMICSVLPVPPPAMRPSVKHDAQQRSEDDLTTIYSNIIKTNIDLKKKINEGADINVINGMTLVLEYYVAMVANNKVKGSFPMAQRSGRPLQCIYGRINSKNGRIRGNLMGKRVNFSARSVITGDPNLSINQLGVPLKIAMNLTKPVVVNSRNIYALTALVRNGPDVYPGAKTLERKGELDPISLRNLDTTQTKLKEGDIVHRHLIDGDFVLFNRQPSLHRMSMMALIVKVMMVGDTFRINVGITKPFNADFDGDEMNMHVPQNIMAEVELAELAAVPYQIVSPANNSPIIGIFQDSLLGAYRFTRERLLFTPQEAMRLLMMFPNINITDLNESIKQNDGYISNFDILTQIMPPLTIKYNTKFFEKGIDNPETSNNVLEIQNGKYLRGHMEKSVINGGTKGLIHQIYNVYGPKITNQFIDNFQNIITEYMKTASYSVGVSDLIAGRSTYEAITHIIEMKKEEVQNLLTEVHLGIFKNVTSQSNIQEFEIRVKQILEEARGKTESEAKKSLNQKNRFLMIVASGSKGSLVNITQMIACLGQQDVDGKRIPYGFDSRTLPHYNKYDDSATARGFIENSYISGLTSHELFFHAMAGRIGLIDTAVKTSQTGYIQRRLIKGLEDLKVEYDMTVRNSMGKIVQFRYGDDGCDSTKVEAQNISLVNLSIEEIYNHYSLLGTKKEKEKLLVVYTKEAAKRFKNQMDSLQKICKTWTDTMLEMRDKLVTRVFQYKNETTVNTPIGFAFLISNIQGQLSLMPNDAVDITPLEAYKLLDEYYEKISSMVFSAPTELFKTLYYYYLAPKELLEKKRFHKKALTLLLETVYLKYRQSLIHPGEKVGVVSGQSVGEPTTQLTLNTFHLSGVASKSNVTRGVPRIEEILRLTENPKNPSMTVYLKELERESQEKANYYATLLTHTRLIDVVKSMEICFDPNNKSEEDAQLLERFYEFERQILQQTETNTGGSKWIIRLELNREKMLDKNITMDDIHFAIKNSYSSEDIHCIFSDFNMDKLIFRLRVQNNVFQKGNKREKGGLKSLDKSDDIYLLKNFQDSLLKNIVLRGVSGIENVQPRKLTNIIEKKDGKYVENKGVWILDTTGSNLLDTLALNFIDPYNTFSNDIKEVFDVLGIEAARQVIYNEFNDVMMFSGVYINYHHLSLLCDRMTSNKCLVSIYRTGILKDNIGPIAKATFEVHTEVLLDAARHAQFDSMRGVSANVMCGQFGYFGTNAFQVLLDLDKFKETRQFNQDDRVAKIEEALEMQDEGICSLDKIRISGNIRDIASIHVISPETVLDIGF
jgi:DNA-directed RNA polymerase II subunit RPB1